MKILTVIILFFTLQCPVFAGIIKIDGVEFHYRVPEKYGKIPPLMVLFGGRNWDGCKTLNTFKFNKLADKYGIFLLSPSFRDRDYWEPEAWSGKLLLQAVSALEKRFKVNFEKIYFYGYSAGGQCVALFQQWMPEKVAACGIHACGVYPAVIKSARIPVLITCGTEDSDRLRISRDFVYRYREQGGRLLWKYFPGAGHELSAAALEMAEIWFDDIISGKKVRHWGEDDTGQTGGEIEPEFRNPLYSEKLEELWRK